MAFSVRTSVGYIDDLCLGADAPSLAMIKRRKDWSKARWSSVEAGAMCDLLRDLGFTDVRAESCFPESSYADEDDGAPFDVGSSQRRPKDGRFFGQPAHAM
jgi:hypothetical protein